MKLKQKGFTTLEILLVFIILAAVGFVGYYVYNSKKQTDKTLNAAQNETSAVKVSKTTVTTFDECQKAPGSVDQETYPVICVTKSGQRFTQTTSSNASVSDTKVFKIPELGIQFNLPTSISDLTYSASGNIGVDVSTASLTNIDPACKATDEHGGLGGIGKRTGTSSANNAPDIFIKQFDGYYIVYDPPQIDCSSKQAAIDQISSGTKTLQDVLPTAQPIAQ